MKKLFALVALMLLVNSGCMTMFTSASYPVKVTSKTPGIKVRADNGVTITTPGEFLLSRSDDHDLFVLGSSDSEHETIARTIHIESKSKAGNWAGSILLNTAAFGWWSIGIGTVVGVGSDAAAGRLKGLPDTVAVDTNTPRVLHDHDTTQPPPIAAAQENDRRDAFDNVSAQVAFCSHCGKKLVSEAEFCQGCGAHR
jgi:hypothetical protein